MKKIARLSSLMMAVALGGCTYSQDAIFPSLFGSDVQERASEAHNWLNVRMRGSSYRGLRG